MSQSGTASRRLPTITRIAAVRPRHRVLVTGTIRSTAAEPVGASPGFRCVIADGSGEIDMLFLGHQHVAGLTPRRRCTAEGMACVYQDRLVIWNPRYSLQLAGPASETAACPAAPAAGKASCRGPRGPRAVVIGDDPGMRRVIEVNLATRGYQVDVAATSAVAGSSDLHDAGLIIVDIGLAEAAGLTTIRALRDASAAPILTISALGGEAVARACASAGSDDFLAKPFPISALVGKVATHLEAVGHC